MTPEHIIQTIRDRLGEFANVPDGGRLDIARLDIVRHVRLDLLDLEDAVAGLRERLQQAEEEASDAALVGYLSGAADARRKTTT